jgi:uncharacterized glyoxalase superfamily protein PhnB
MVWAVPQPIPPGHHPVTPSFIVPNLAATIAFLERVLDAKVVDRYDNPDGTIGHAELVIGGSVVMCGDPMPGWEARPGVFTRYVDDAATVDATFRRAIDAGAKPVREPKLEFYGHRVGTFLDPGGNRWNVSAVVEDVGLDEIHRRFDAMVRGG